MIEDAVLSFWPRVAPKLTILIYHRVLPQPDPLRIGEIDAETFDRQMAFLARQFTVMSLMDAVESMRASRLPERACCITFDDGYADNLTIAQPILAQYRLPATVFVATGYLDGGRMFNDTVIELVARAEGVVLNLDAIGLGQHRLDSIEHRRSAIKKILGVVRFLPPFERNRLVSKMVQSVPCGPLPNDLMLTTAQLKTMSELDVEIGGHTVAHTILTSLDIETARAEINEGKNRLEEITGKRVRTFAYPNGRPGQDYGAEHVALVRDLQFEVAVTTGHGVSDGKSDAFQLPRFTPWGKSTVMLAARMMRNARLGMPVEVCTPNVSP